MAELPSFTRSTLSILAVFSVVAYAIAAGFVAYATAFHQMPPNGAGAVMKPFEILMLTFGASYLTARGTAASAKNSPPPITTPTS